MLWIKAQEDAGLDIVGVLPLMQGGKLDVEEEFQQSCFHISVYRAYLPATKRRPVARSEVAQLREPRVPRIAARSDQDQ